jgi:hypothetical protein
MGTMGLDSGRPEPPGGTYDGPTVEPPVSRVLLGARADGASKDLCAAEAIWPRVLTPVNGTLVSDADATALTAG